MMTEYDDYIKGIEEALSFADSVVGRYEGDANIQRYNLWVKRRGELRDLLARARGSARRGRSFHLGHGTA
jgi:hypothetical protein